MTGAATASFPIFAAAAAAPKHPLIVSLHDVAPVTREASARIIEELGRHGVDVCSLLVVPNYHARGASLADRDFSRWLRDLESAGHEVVIHGYFHQRPRHEREALRERLLTGYYTRDEAEFYDLDYVEALERITRARDEFRAAGLKPRGFIAPAWLLGNDGERAAADAEMEYTTRLTSVVDLRTRRAFHARSLVYSVRSQWRRFASLGWNRALSHLQANNALVRLGIHPPDFEHALVHRQIVALADHLSAVRVPTTYRDWVAERRMANAG